MRLGLGVDVDLWKSLGGGIPAPAFTADFTTGAVPAGMTLSRASNGSFYSSVGVLHAAGPDAPRFDYDPTTLTLKGLLLEQQSTNLLLWSQDTTNATAWGNNTGSATITVNSPGAPNGTATFNHWTRTTTAPSFTGQGITKPSSVLPYAATVYAKIGTVGKYLNFRIQGSYPDRMDYQFDLSAGTVTLQQAGGSSMTGSATIQKIGNNGIYRISTVTTTDVLSALTTYYSFSSLLASQVDTTDTALSDGYVWGFQLEQLGFATSYILTTTSAATRAADICFVPAVYNAAASSFAVSFISITGSAYTQNYSIATLSDTSAANLVSIRAGNLTPTINWRTTSGGVTQYSDNFGTLAASTQTKLGVSLSVNSLNYFQDGARLGGEAVYTVPSSLLAFNIGSANLGNNPVSGWFQSASCWNTKLSNAQMQEVTA